MSDVIQGFPQGNFDEKEDMQKGRWAENENLKTWQTDQQEKDIGIAKSMQKHMGGTKDQDTVTRQERMQGNPQGNLDEDRDAPLQPWKGEMVNPEEGIMGQKESVMRKRYEDQIHKVEPGVGQNFGERKFQAEKPEAGERSTEKMKKEGELAENLDFIQKGDTETNPHLDLRGSEKTIPAQELIYNSEKEKDIDIDNHNKKTNLTEHQNEWMDQLNESGGEYKREYTQNKGEHSKEVGARRSESARQKQQHPFPQQENRLNALAQDYERQKVAVEEQLHRNKQDQKVEKMTLKQQMKPTQHFKEGKRDQYDIDRQHQKNQNQMSEKRKAHQEIQTSVKAVK